VTYSPAATNLDFRSTYFRNKKLRCFCWGSDKVGFFKAPALFNECPLVGSLKKKLN